MSFLRSGSLSPSFPTSELLSPFKLRTRRLQRANHLLNDSETTLNASNPRNESRSPLGANNSLPVPPASPAPALTSPPLSSTFIPGTVNWAIALFNEGGIQSSTDMNCRVVLECPACHTKVKTNLVNDGPIAGKSRFFHSLSQHWGQKSCRKAQGRLSKENNDHIIHDSPKSSNRPPHSFSSSVSTINSSGSSHILSDSSARSYSAPTEGCSGVPIHWNNPLGPFNLTFPWPRIGPGPDSLPFWVRIIDEEHDIRNAKSKKCQGEDSATVPCRECEGIPSIISQLLDQATTFKSHMRYSLLSSAQLVMVINDQQKDLNTWKLKQYKTVAKGSITNPMRNVPIFCQLCPGDTLASKPVIWRYNYMHHVRVTHPSYACPGIPVNGQVRTRLPHTVWTDMEITAEEQKAARIPETHRIPSFSEYEPANVNDSVDSAVGRKRTKKAGIPKEKTSKKQKI